MKLLLAISIPPICICARRRQGKRSSSRSATMFAKWWRGNEPVSEDIWTYCNTGYFKRYRDHSKLGAGSQLFSAQMLAIFLGRCDTDT